jgi:hypothetical protein
MSLAHSYEFAKRLSGFADEVNRIGPRNSSADSTHLCRVAGRERLFRRAAVGCLSSLAISCHCAAAR